MITDALCNALPEFGIGGSQLDEAGCDRADHVGRFIETFRQILNRSNDMALLIQDVDSFTFCLIRVSRAIKH